MSAAFPATKVARETLRELEARRAGTEPVRTPGGVYPAGVYYNGFAAGLDVAIGLLKRKESEL